MALITPYLDRDDMTPGELYRARGSCSKCGAPGPLKDPGNLVVTLSENEH